MPPPLLAAGPAAAAPSAAGAEPPPAPAPPRAARAAPAPAPVRSIDVGAPIPVRRSGGSATGAHRAGRGRPLLLVAGGALWMWRQATIAQQDAEARLAKAEKRFAEVRQLGQRLAEVDHLLAVTPDPAAQHGACGAAAHVDAVPDRPAARLRIDGPRAADRGGQGLPPAGGVARRHLGPHARRSRRRRPHAPDRREPAEAISIATARSRIGRCGRS